MNGWKKYHVVLGVIATVLAISAIVYGSARAGVEAAVRAEINSQIEQSGSALNRQIRAEIHAHEADVCEPRWRETRDRMTEIAERQVVNETKLDIILERTAP